LLSDLFRLVNRFRQSNQMLIQRGRFLREDLRRGYPINVL
jgi:hypothetical protein